MNKKIIIIIFILLVIIGIEASYIYIHNFQDNSLETKIDDKKAENKKDDIKFYQKISTKPLDNNLEDSKYYINSDQELEKFYNLYEEIDELNKDKKSLTDYTAFIEVVSSNENNKITLKSVTIENNKIVFNIDNETNKEGEIVPEHCFLIAFIPNEELTNVDISEWIKPSKVSSNEEFTLNSANKYIVITNTKYLTMQNDGGSHTNIFYEIDLDTNNITKIKENYQANLGATLDSVITKVYTKNIDAELSNEVKKILNEALTKEDINEPENYNFLIIETLNNKKEIYSLETISNINKLFSKIDEL